ncbi:hypothetical protein, conserved [Eimeria acervulina]|uniref:CPW-WPC domain-containing protein n=1 Tax=Eimeria acervulina TaxID=5801 RepID=U6GE67_EIMAC|nr:hypothetical protein, conserved [Eimeria acervulina]CDI78455.1 hypothetical protein, conserved [Eimeria acervulina]
MLMQMPLCFAFIFSCFSCWCFVAGGLIKQWPPADFPSTEKLEQEVESLGALPSVVASAIGQRDLHPVLRRAEAEWPCKGDATHACSTGVRDFTLPCPEGFALRPDGESCEAIPGSYSGMCPLVANFSGFSDAAKNSWSVR